MTKEEREALDGCEIDQDPLALDVLEGKDDKHDILALYRVNNLENHKGMIEAYGGKYTIITPIYEVNLKDPNGESFVGWARLRIRKMTGIDPFVVAYPFYPD